MSRKSSFIDHAVLYLPVSTFVGTSLFTLCKEKLMKRHTEHQLQAGMESHYGHPGGG